MFCKEACSGQIDDSAHVRTEVCLADCLTKASAKVDVLRKAIETGILPNVDMHPSLRLLMRHKAFLTAWTSRYLGSYTLHTSFLGTKLWE